MLIGLTAMCESGVMSENNDKVGRRQWHPTPVLLPENPMDGGAW